MCDWLAWQVALVHEPLCPLGMDTSTVWLTEVPVPLCPPVGGEGRLKVYDSPLSVPVTDKVFVLVLLSDS